MHSSINHPTISEDVVRPTVVEVDCKRLRTNLEAIRAHAGDIKIMPILKANAYGHGLIRVAQLMQEFKVDCIGVAVLEEGILLRENGIHIPILVLGGILGNQVPHFLRHDLTITASSIEKLNQIEEAAERMQLKARVHLKIDTGMERIGVHYYNVEPFLKASTHCRHVFVEGIFSHFANAESADLTHARLQLERFQDVLSVYDKLGAEPPPVRHIANSGAILQLPGAYYNCIRPGILLYGVYPSDAVPRTISVQPALSWKSRVVYFKVIQPGHSVGYGSTWTAEKAVRSVTIPVGYGDGYFRSMFQKAHVLIHGKKYPVIGTISMDQIVVNIESDSAFNEDEVVLLGEQDGHAITCEDMARWAGTIPYEILTNINTRVPRVYK